MANALPVKIKDKHLHALIERADAQGFDVRWRKGATHLGIYAPDGSWVTSVGATPSDQKCHLPIRAALRRAGYRGH